METIMSWEIVECARVNGLYDPNTKWYRASDVDARIAGLEAENERFRTALLELVEACNGIVDVPADVSSADRWAKFLKAIAAAEALK